MAYGKLKRFAEENETCNGFLEEGQVFEAWTIYIRECEKVLMKFVKTSIRKSLKNPVL